MELDTQTNNQTVLYCYHSVNISCIKHVRPFVVSVILYLLASVAAMLTFCGNLVVIISISHFKQLHTPTNILVLSLAVADFLVGLLIMPFMVIRSVESCWYFGDIICSVYTTVLFVLTEVSILNLVIIAIDRYVALCDPLLYSTKITVGVASLSVAIVWLVSLIYSCSVLFTDVNTKEAIGSNRCPGDCILILSQIWSTVDIIFSFIFPVFIMITLYTKIFVVARRHIRAISMQQKDSGNETKTRLVKKSERKAATTLAIVVVVFILCWLPYYIYTILNQFITFPVPPAITGGFLWLAYLNSGLNPIIYALFYPWFRKSLEQILTLNIFLPGSSLMSLIPEN